MSGFLLSPIAENVNWCNAVVEPFSNKSNFDFVVDWHVIAIDVIIFPGNDGSESDAPSSLANAMYEFSLLFCHFV